MKKLFAVLAVIFSLTFGLTFSALAQDAAPAVDSTSVEQVATDEAVVEETVAPVVEEGGIHQALKQKFIEGGAGFMASVALCLILGLAVCI